MLNKVRQLLRKPIKVQPCREMYLDGHELTLDNLTLLGKGETKIQLNETAWDQLRRTRAVVDRIVNSLEVDKGLYFGINTGVGAFSNKRIPLEEMKEYQINLIRSHATGIGEFLPLNTSRRILALRINTLAKGYSGMSVNTMRGLVDFYNSGCVPQIP